MNVPPDGFDEAALVRAIAEGWGFRAVSIAYAPVGFGSHHWIAADAAGERRFVTVDQLHQKPWLGDDPASVLDGLTRAYATARALQAAGLSFVVAPLATRAAGPLRPFGADAAVSLFPLVSGEAGRSGRHETVEDRLAVVDLLARLHGATDGVRSIARAPDLAIAGRSSLASAIGDTDRPWSGGPLSEPARALVARSGRAIDAALAAADALVASVATRRGDWVVTHGEPHARNVIRHGHDRFLVDWDTVALAPRERDLWMLLGADALIDADRYERRTGNRPDPAVCAWFRLAWDLADVAAFVDVLRASHRDTVDTRKSLVELTRLVDTIDQWGRVDADPSVHAGP